MTTNSSGDVGEMSIEQLAARVGMSVRTVRFYGGRGLIPPPRREGRNGFYGADHVVRLEFVRELQAHGFTLSAIEGYLEKIPTDAPPEQIALHRTLLTPWAAERPETLSRTQLQTRAGRELSDDDIELLVAIGVVEPTPSDDVFQVASAHLAIGVQFLEFGLSAEAALRTRRVIEEHGRAIAQELTAVFREYVWPELKGSGQPPETAIEMIERFKPFTVQALVTAFETGVDDEKRETIVRRRG